MKSTILEPELEPLPKIPTPRIVYWREFCQRVLPVIVFALVLGAVALMWGDAAVNSGVAGVGDGVRSLVSSPQAGFLQKLEVEPYQIVEAGQPIALILPRDPQAQLGLLQTEVDLARMRFQPSIAEDNAMNFEQIRIELLRTKSELAMARVNLELAANAVRRNAPLYQEKLVSEDLYDLAAKTRDLYLAEVDAKSNAVALIEMRVEALAALGVPRPEDLQAPLQLTLARLQAGHADAATNWAPITLVAPIRGMITQIHRHAGENVIEGEPLILISSLEAERIVGFIRQPYIVEPQIGMEVLITTREQRRQQFHSFITQVGAQIEMITNALAFVKTGALIDSGLPVTIDVPAGLKLRAGEIVDLALQPNPSAPSAPEAALARGGPDLK